DRRQRVQARYRAVDLAATVVGDDQAVDAERDRLAGVVGMEHSLEQDRELRRVAEECEVAPGEGRARVDVEEGADRRAWLGRAEVSPERARVCARELNLRPQGRQVRPPGVGGRGGSGGEAAKDGIARVLRDPL